MSPVHETGGDTPGALVGDQAARAALREAAARDVAAWPDVTPDQRKRLALLLWSAGLPECDT